MRLVVLDYSGHPGQAQLSRALASRGHDVAHLHCSSYVSGHGSLERGGSDATSLRFEDVPMIGTFRRYNPARRIGQELAYGVRIASAVRRHRPDAAIISNVPLLAHTVATLIFLVSGVRQIFWQQDIYSAAIAQTARDRLGRLGAGPAWIARRLEQMIVRLSAGVVCIAPVFRTELLAWGTPAAKVRVIPNWGPLDEVGPRPKDNAWARRAGLADREVVMYSGTLGLKHDPSVFIRLALWMRQHRPEARVVVISEGRGRKWLESRSEVRAGLAQLVLLDFQPYEELSEVLSTGDVLVAVLEPAASRFSVPSKVLTYLCAGRPVVALLPEGNFVADIVRAGPGKVVDPEQIDEAIAVVANMLSSPDERDGRGSTARRYAEEHFAIDRIAAEFESAIGEWIGDPSPSRRHAVSSTPVRHR